MKALQEAKIVQPLKWHGGKHYLAARIIGLMPAHVHYVEPFFGGGSVLLGKDPSNVSEVANDVCGELTNFWRVLRDPIDFAAFARAIDAMPFSQREWRQADGVGGDPVDRAVAFFVRCRQSRAGKLDSFATLSRNRTRRGMNEQASAWMTAVAGLPTVAARLRRVVILDEDACRVIRSQDGPGTLFYLDPPYLRETRVSTGDYEHEMSDEAHRELLDTVLQCRGRVILSGYPSELYDSRLAGWRTVDFEIDNKASSAKRKPTMTERLWMNFAI